MVETSVFNVFTDAYTRFNIELDNIIVASESFNTTSSDIISSNNYFKKMAFLSLILCQMMVNMQTGIGMHI